jgi:hypothetical protein
MLLPINVQVYMWLSLSSSAEPACLCWLLPQVNQLAPTGCSSSIHLWALRHQEDRSLKQQPLLAGLAVDQQQYPTPEALCAQVRHMRRSVWWLGKCGMYVLSAVGTEVKPAEDQVNFTSVKFTSISDISMFHVTSQPCTLLL